MQCINWIGAEIDQNVSKCYTKLYKKYLQKVVSIKEYIIEFDV